MPGDDAPRPPPEGAPAPIGTAPTQAIDMASLGTAPTQAFAAPPQATGSVPSIGTAPTQAVDMASLGTASTQGFAAPPPSAGPPAGAAPAPAAPVAPPPRAPGRSGRTAAIVAAVLLAIAAAVAAFLFVRPHPVGPHGSAGAHGGAGPPVAGAFSGLSKDQIRARIEEGGHRVLNESTNEGVTTWVISTLVPGVTGSVKLHRHADASSAEASFSTLRASGAAVARDGKAILVVTLPAAVAATALLNRIKS